MRIEVVTPPVSEPVSVDEARAWLRVASEAEDDLIGQLVTAARAQLEEMTGYALAPQTRRLVLDDFPAGRTLRLPRPPLRAVSGVTYLDEAGVEHTVDDADYEVRADGTPGAIYAPLGWPDGVSLGPNSVAVTFTCGFGDGGEALPAQLRVALQQLVTHWYDNRTPIVIGTTASQVPRTLDYLTAAYRFRYLSPLI